MTKEEIIELAKQADFLDYELDDGTTDAFDKRYESFAKLVAKRTWVGLTDEDDLDWEEGGSLKDLVKAIETKLKEKNT